MALRKYTLDEIGKMRRALRYIVEQSEGSSCYPSMNRAAINVAAELQLRTYMLNGTDPEELEEEKRGWEITCADDDDYESTGTVGDQSCNPTRTA